MSQTAVVKSAPQGGTVATPDERVEVAVQKMEDKFGALLGTAIDSARFCRVAINAIQQTKDMDQVIQTPEGRDSIYTACLQAASDNLLLDKRSAALVVYSEKYKDGNAERWRKVAKYMPMYQGLLELAHGSGVLTKIVVQLVHAKDTFRVMPTSGGCPIHHEFPEDPFADRGDIRGGYAVAQFRDGTWSDAQVMSVDEINKIRARSKTSESGPWKTDWPEMARKTLIRRVVKYLPRTIPGLEKFDAAAHRVDEMYQLDGPDDGRALPGPERKTPMAKQLLAPQAPPPPAPSPPAEVKKPAAEPKAKAKAESQPKGKPVETPQVPIPDEGYDERGGGGDRGDGWDDEDTGV